VSRLGLQRFDKQGPQMRVDRRAHGSVGLALGPIQFGIEDGGDLGPLCGPGGFILRSGQGRRVALLLSFAPKLTAAFARSMRQFQIGRGMGWLSHVASPLRSVRAVLRCLKHRASPLIRPYRKPG
jgi:hypothetical protein